jgi:hypothetical protein
LIDAMVRERRQSGPLLRAARGAWHRIKTIAAYG